MLHRIMNALARITPVHVARTQEERAAIYRMRYAIYAREQNDTAIAGVDHARQEIRTPEDELPETTLFYTGTVEHMTGSMRVRVWKPGQIPRDFHRRYSLERFHDIDARTVCTVGFLMATPTARGKAGVAALTSAAGERTIADHGVEVMVADCSPGLLYAYRRLGLRPYGARMLSLSRGLQIPLVHITADLEHARCCGSPWYPTLRRLAAQGKLPSGDISALLAPLARGGIETDPERMLAEVEATVARHGSTFLERLPKATRRRLLEGALITDVAPDLDMLVEGYVNRDLFVLLDGALEIRRDGAHVATLTPGHVLGEVAFFRANGQRSATVRSTAPSRVLHIRHSAVRRLAARRTADAAAIYDALAHVLAERSATSSAGDRPTPVPEAPRPRDAAAGLES